MPLSKRQDYEDRQALKNRVKELEQQNLNLRQELALARKIVRSLRARVREDAQRRSKAIGEAPRGVTRGHAHKAPETASGDRL